LSQTDFCIGLVLDELERLSLDASTMVVLHSDHGWQLGERGEWDKQTNFEAATLVPLLIKVPWKPASQGQRTSSFTELVDMHPTGIRPAIYIQA
jgi:iduronate 2-sulfatase